MAMESNGYGAWWPRTNEFLARVRGRSERVSMRTERWEGGIDYAVCVHDPDDASAREEGEDMREIWTCSVTFKAGEEHPMPRAVAAAREQQRIADELVARYLRGAVS